MAPTVRSLVTNFLAIDKSYLGLNIMNKEQFDDFRIQVELLEPAIAKSTTLPGAYVVRTVLFLNDEEFAKDFVVDLFALAKSCQLSGEFFIATCSCGEPGCAGIDEGIKVTHFYDSILWQVPEPLKYSGMKSEDIDADEEKISYREFKFYPEAYMQEVKQALSKIKEFIKGKSQPVELAISCIDKNQIIELDPQVFSERGAPLGCKIIAKTLKIDRTPGWVTINKISYRLGELPVPEEILALDDWSEWEPKPHGKGYLCNYLAAPEAEVMRRIRVLENYLGSIRAN